MADYSSTLDDLLSKWHDWCRGFSLSRTASADPMFRNAKSSRGWDTVDEILDGELNNSTMKTIDFHVGEIQHPYRAAIYVIARNLHTGRSVWNDPRLPAEIEKRAEIAAKAREILISRLTNAGVL